MAWGNRDWSFPPPRPERRATSTPLRRWRRWPPSSDLSCGAFFCLQSRQPGLPTVDEVAQQRPVVGAHRRAHRRTSRQAVAPTRGLWLVGQNTEIADLIKGVEIADHRAEHGIDEGELFAVKPGRRNEALLQPCKALLELGDFGLEGPLVLCGIESRDIIEHGRAEFDPAAMLGTRNRIGRM